MTPLVAVCPRTVDETAAALDVARSLEVPINARGAGTSVAGNAVRPGIVLDFSRHMNRVLSIDPESRTAVVQSGTVQTTLQAAPAPYSPRFGPDPSTRTRCTIGGMIGHNACDSRTLGYGQTSDNVTGLQVSTGGRELLQMTTGVTPSLVSGPDGSAVLTALQSISRSGLAAIRTEFAQFGRQVSGYALGHLLPENRFDVARMLVGSEGSLALVREASVRLVTEPAHRVLVVLGYPDIASADDASPTVLTFSPTACEGIDSRIVDVVRERRGPGAVPPPLARGAAWLFVEVVGDTVSEAVDRAQTLGRSCGALDSLVVTDNAQAASVWRIRADGAGLAGRSPAGLPAQAGWEDAAVPPARLGGYLRVFDSLMNDFGVTGLPYGHFSDVCLHIRINLPLDKPGGTTVFREFLPAAGASVAEYGASLSGEHGDGRARSELLPSTYSPEALDLYAAVKHAFDPANVLNPGIVVAQRRRPGKTTRRLLRSRRKLRCRERILRSVRRGR